MDEPGLIKRPKSEKVLVIGCGMLAREIIAIKALSRLDHLEVVCLPADLHFRPDRIPAAMENAIKKAKSDGFDHIFAAYADCGTGGMLDRVLAAHGVRRMGGPHCFAFYQGLNRFDEIGEGDMLAFYMTDFLCRHFESFFLKPLGLDRHPELIAEFFGNYEKLIYLAQTDDPALEKVARHAAAMLGLDFERRFTGYGDLDGALKAAHADALS